MHTVVWSIGQDGSTSTVFTAIIITLKCLPGRAPAPAVTSCSSKGRADPPQADLALATVCLLWGRPGQVGGPLSVSSSDSGVDISPSPGTQIREDFYNLP